MGDSLNDIAIKMGIDNSGVKSGLNGSSRMLREYYAEQAKLAKNQRQQMLREGSESASITPDKTMQSMLAAYQSNAAERKTLISQLYDWQRQESVKAAAAEQEAITATLAKERAAHIARVQIMADELRAWQRNFDSRKSMMDQLAEYQAKQAATPNVGNAMGTFAAQQKQQADAAVAAAKAVAVQDQMNYSTRMGFIKSEQNAQATAFAALKADYKQREAAEAARVTAARNESAIKIAEIRRQQAELKLIEERKLQFALNDNKKATVVDDGHAERTAAARLMMAERRAKDSMAGRIKDDKDAQLEFNAALKEVANINARNASAAENYSSSMARLNYLRSMYNKDTGLAILGTEEYYREVRRLREEFVRLGRAAQGAQQDTKDVGRIATGVLGQASFAAEDFIQGMVFGDVRAALLGASNNMTMVVRGLWQMNTAGGAAAISISTIGVAVGTVAVAAGAMYAGYQYFFGKAVRDTDDLTAAIKKATDALGVLQGNLERKTNARAFEGRIRDIKDSNDALKAQKALEEQLANSQDKLDRTKMESRNIGDAAFKNTLGGAEAEAELDVYLQNLVNAKNANSALAEAIQKTKAEARDAFQNGEGEKAIHILRKLHEQMQQLSTDQQMSGDPFAALDTTLNDLTALDALQEKFSTGFLSYFIDGKENIAELEALKQELLKQGNDIQSQSKDQKQMEEQINRLIEKRIQMLENEKQARDVVADVIRQQMLLELDGWKVAQDLAKLEKDKIAAKEKFMGPDFNNQVEPAAPGSERAVLEVQFELAWEKKITDERNTQLRLTQEELEAKRQMMLFQLKATDAQKALMATEKEMQQFIGAELLNAQMAGNMMGGGFMLGNQMAADAQANQFLLAQKAALEKEILKMAPPVTVQGGLGTNGGNVQAAAIEQAMRATFNKPNPQLEALRVQLAAINTALTTNTTTLVNVP